MMGLCNWQRKLRSVDKANDTSEECTYGVSVIVSANNRLIYNDEDATASGASPSFSLSFAKVPAE